MSSAVPAPAESTPADLPRVALLSGSRITLAAQAIKFTLTLVSAMVLGRLLRPDDYGLVGMVTAITSLLAVLQYLGLSTVTVQRERISAAEVNALFWVNTGFGAALSLLTCALAPVIAWFYRSDALTPVALAMAPTFLIGAAGVQPLALLQRRHRFHLIAGVEVFSLLCSFLVAAVLALNGFEHWSLVAGNLAATTFGTVAAFVAASWTFSSPARLADIGGLLRFGGHLTGFNVVNYFARNFDNLLIGRVWGPIQLGLYSRAYQLLLLPMEQINAPLSVVAVPMLSRLLRQPEDYRAAYLRLVRVTATLTTPALVLLTMCADWVVLIVLGPNWTDTARIFTALGAAALVQPVARTTGWLFVTQDRSREMFRWGIVHAGLAIVAFAAGIAWGALGVAVAYSAVDVLVRTPLLIWTACRTGPVGHRDLIDAVRPHVAAAVASAIALVCVRAAWPPGSALGGLLVAVVVTATTFGLVLRLQAAGRLSLEDLAAMAPWQATRLSIK